jgi:hypothetical protein
MDDPDKLLPFFGLYLAELLAADDATLVLNKRSFEGPDCLVSPTAACAGPGYGG